MYVFSQPLIYMVANGVFNQSINQSIIRKICNVVRGAPACNDGSRREEVHAIGSLNGEERDILGSSLCLGLAFLYHPLSTPLLSPDTVKVIIYVLTRPLLVVD